MIQIFKWLPQILGGYRHVRQIKRRRSRLTALHRPAVKHCYRALNEGVIQLDGGQRIAILHLEHNAINKPGTDVKPRKPWA